MYCTLCGEIPGPGPLVVRQQPDRAVDAAEASPEPTAPGRRLRGIAGLFGRARPLEPREES